MKSFKKTSLVLLSLLMVFVLSLTGCGTPAGETSAQAGTSPAVAAESTATAAEPTVQQLEPVELTWYQFGAAFGSDQSTVENAVAEYLKDKINVTLKMYSLGWDEFRTKTSSLTAAGEPYDLLFSASWIGFNEYREMNMYRDITDDIGKYCPETLKLLNENESSKQLWTGGTYKDRIYAIPTLKEVGHCEGINVNMNLVDKYGLDISNIKTAADLEPLMQSIKEKEPNVYPIIYNGGFDPTKWIGTYSVLNDDVIPLVCKRGSTKIELTYDVPEYVESLKMVNNWYKKGYLPKDIPIMDPTSFSTFAQEGTIFINAVNALPGAGAGSSNDKVRYQEIQMNTPSVSTKDLGGSQNSVSATSKNPERALMFLELYNTDETLNNLISFGVKDKHYKVVSDKVIERIPDSGYQNDHNWANGNQLLNYLLKDEDPQKWGKFEEFNKSAVPDPSIGFEFDTAPFKDNIVAIKSILDGNYLFWGITKKGVDEDVADLKEKLKAAGIYELRDAVQAAYDQWLASKQ